MKQLLQNLKAGLTEIEDVRARARQGPEKVRQFLDEIRTDGLVHTVETILNKREEPMSLYKNALVKRQSVS